MWHLQDQRVKAKPTMYSTNDHSRGQQTITLEGKKHYEGLNLNVQELDNRN
jgi:hypothetical protein